MKYILELTDEEKQEIIDITASFNIHGHINNKYKEQRKPTVSKIGKDCAKAIVNSVFAYLKAFEIK